MAGRANEIQARLGFAWLLRVQLGLARSAASGKPDVIRVIGFSTVASRQVLAQLCQFIQGSNAVARVALLC